MLQNSSAIHPVGLSSGPSTHQGAVGLTAAALLLVTFNWLHRSPAALQRSSAETSFPFVDVLGDRMVIPPGKPDWLLLNCDNAEQLNRYPVLRKACENR